MGTDLPAGVQVGGADEGVRGDAGAVPDVGVRDKLFPVPAVAAPQRRVRPREEHTKEDLLEVF